MNLGNIVKSPVFKGISPKEIEPMLQCLQVYKRKYKKGDYVFRANDQIDSMGLVLSGSVNIEQSNIWGSQNILNNIGEGQVFAETYACLSHEALMVDIVVTKEAEILFLNIYKLMQTCSSACSFHNRLILNLLEVMASKNLNLTRKISHITPKSIRDRLLSYLSFQALKHGQYSFEIPFNRQQLADYLCVDRSALSNELSKMRKEGLLSYEKNKFHLSEEAATID